MMKFDQDKVALAKVLKAQIEKRVPGALVEIHKCYCGCALIQVVVYCDEEHTYQEVTGAVRAVARKARREEHGHYLMHGAAIDIR